MKGVPMGAMPSPTSPDIDTRNVRFERQDDDQVPMCDPIGVQFKDVMTYNLVDRWPD